MSIKIKQMLNDKTADDNTLSGILADVANCGVPAINKFKNDEKREFDNFNSLVNMVKYIDDNFFYGEKEFSLMVDYAEQLDPNKKTARYMLEYLDSHMLIEAKQQLIERMLNSSNKDSIQWASLYKIDDKVSRNEIDPFEAIKEYNKAKANSLELDIITSIFTTYIYMDQKVYSQAFNMLNSELNRVNDVKEEFIRKMFKSRLLLLKAEYHGRKNEVEDCRNNCKEVIEEIDHVSKKAWAYLHLGNSYIVTDYQKANECFDQAIGFNYIHANVKNNLERSSNFLNNLWNKQANYLNFESNNASEIHEIAFYYINKEDHEKATQTLESVNLDKCIDNERAFHFYLKGLISNDIKDLTKSISYFNKSGDVYFKQLPVLKLKSFNVHDSIIELLSE